mmetsp:Transcript_3794/g.11108  ORF Transcript_3794/g.11108 Transcript_3794/m.11108 type:complete len:132 (+) Transcript_3794:213-608(+)
MMCAREPVSSEDHLLKDVLGGGNGSLLSGRHHAHIVARSYHSFHRLLQQECRARPEQRGLGKMHGQPALRPSEVPFLPWPSRQAEAVPRQCSAATTALETAMARSASASHQVLDVLRCGRVHGEAPLGVGD